MLVCALLVQSNGHSCSYNRHLMLAQVKQRDERRIVDANSGTPDGIMGGVGLQGHAMFSTRRDFNVQVCSCQPEMTIHYALAHKLYCLLQEGALVLEALGNPVMC